MPSSHDVAEFRRLNSSVVDLAKDDLTEFWRGLDIGDAEFSRDALLEFMPALNDQYGTISSAVAADWYDELRDSSSARGQYRATATGAVPAEQVQASVRYAAGALWADDVSPLFSHLVNITDKFVKQAGRDTVARSVSGDRGATYCRVPTGTETCAFCLMLASRGPVYGGKIAAGGEGNRYHGDCDCVPTPSWSGKDLPDGYDLKALNDIYVRGVRSAEGGSTSAILAGIRQVSGSH